MNKSEQINELASALSKAQGEFNFATKDTKNDFFKSRYADLASCIEAARVPLQKNGLSVSQLTTIENDALFLETVLMHSSGQWIASLYPIRPVKQDPQGYGSAITYARRYCFSAITGIAADDDDGNAASGKSNSTLQEAKKQSPLAEIKKVLLPTLSDEDFTKKSKPWYDLVKNGSKTPEQLITQLKTKCNFSDEQIEIIKGWAA